MKLLTSINEIKGFGPCEEGLERLLMGFPNRDHAELFPLVDCCDTNSFSDICWLLKKREKELHIAVKAAKLCAESVAHLKNWQAKHAAAYAANAAANANAADAADAAYAAADAAAYADAAYAARKTQTLKNMNFFRQCILDFEVNLETPHGTPKAN